MELEVSYDSLLKLLEAFPCAFNLEGAEKVTRHKLENKRKTILNELKVDENCDEEVLRKKNFLTWIYFRLDKTEKSKELSDEIKDILTTRNAQPNIPYLANRCVVMNRYGNETESKKCLELLKSLKNHNDFPVLLVEAKAEQAYCYSRLGGVSNLKRTIDILTLATEQIPNNYLWKYGLGLALRRATHANIYSSGESTLDVDSYFKNAVELLFEVAEKGENLLQSMAYSQLLILRKVKRPPEMDDLFRKMDESQLCDKALEHGYNNATVLKVCGRIYDVDRSIELLERSVSLRPDTTAYHHLGLSYKRKAQQLAKRKNTVRSLSYHDSPSNITASGLGKIHDTHSHVPNVNTPVRHYPKQRFVNLPNVCSSALTLSPEAGYNVSGQSASFDSRGIGTNKGLSRHAAAGYASDTSVLGDSARSESATVDVDGPGLLLDHKKDNPLQRNQEFQWEIKTGSLLQPVTLDHNSNRGQSMAFLGMNYTSAEIQTDSFYQNTMLDQWGRSGAPIFPFINVKVVDTETYNKNIMQLNDSLSPGLPSNSQESYSPTVENEFRESGNETWTESFVYPIRRNGRGRRSPGCGRFGNSGRYQKQTSNHVPHYNNDYLKQNVFTNSDSRSRRGQQTTRRASWSSVESGIRQDNFSQRQGRPSRFQTSKRATRSQWSVPGSDRSPQEQGVKSYIHHSNTAVKLDKDDELVKKAMDCFTKAVELAKENYPAHLCLALLLKEIGETEEALTKFNYLTKLENDLQTGNRLIIISAYEEAGLLYLQKSQETNNKELEEMGKLKLYKAVGLATQLVNVIPGIDDAQQFWCAFRTLEVDIRKITSPKDQTKQYLKLLDLARKYRTILDVLERLEGYSDNDLDDEDIIQLALNSFLSTNEFEKAVVFHNFVALRDHPWWHTGPVFDLRIQILLKAILGRLTAGEGDYVHLFQQVFELYYGCCLGEAQAGEDEREEQEAELKGDILVVFDDAEVEDRTSTSGRCLQLVASRLYGLSVEENLNGTGRSGINNEAIQLQEMELYSVVILVLGDEVRSPMFEAMMWAVCRIQGPPRQRIVVMDAGLTNGRVPACLRRYPCLKFSDIGLFADAQLDTDSHVTHSDVIQRVFDSNFDAVLRLFSFIIGKSWDSS